MVPNSILVIIAWKISNCLWSGTMRDFWKDFVNLLYYVGILFNMDSRRVFNFPLYHISRCHGFYSFYRPHILNKGKPILYNLWDNSTLYKNPTEVPGIEPWTSWSVGYYIKAENERSKIANIFRFILLY